MYMITALQYFTAVCYAYWQLSAHKVLKLDRTTPTASDTINYTTVDTSPGGNTHYARLAVRPIMDHGEWIVLYNKYITRLKKRKEVK